MDAKGCNNNADDADLIIQAVIYDNAELLRDLLIENPQLVDFKDQNGLTPLHHASIRGHNHCAEILLDFGADVDTVSGGKNCLKTPLLLASENGNTPTLEVLVKYGADLFYFDKNGHSALQLSQMSGNDSSSIALMSIIERIHNDAADKYSRLCSACTDGDISAVLGVLADMPSNMRKQILNGSKPDDKPALFIACEHGRSEIVKALLTVPQTQSSMVYGPTGDNFLHAAVASQDSATVATILEKFPFLVDAANQEDSLCLHWACQCGNLEIVKILLEHPFASEELKFIKINPTQDGCSSTSPAAENEAFHQTIGFYGYRFICDLNAMDSERRTVLHLAVANCHVDVVEYLINFKIQSHFVPSEFVELAVPATEGPLELTSEEAAANKYVHPFFLNAYAKNGRTPLMIASSLGSVEIVRLLLESGRVDVNLPISSPNFFQEDNDDQYCSCSGALLEAVKHQHGQIVHLLQDFGALDYGNRAVALALTTSNSEIIGSLLSKLACADSQNIVNRFAPPAENQSPMLANLRGSSSLTLDLFTAPFSRRPAGSSVPSSHKSLVGVQLNWQNTGGLAQLQFEWFLAAAANFNKHFLTRNTQRLLILSTITRIDLSENKLITLPPYLFTQFYSLRTLNVANNNISCIELPVGISTWQSPRLDTLIFDHNQLGELPTHFFSGAHFPQLRCLSATNNQLDQLPASVWTAPRLRELNVSNNQIHSLRSIQTFDHHRRSNRSTGALANKISRAQQRRSSHVSSGVEDDSSEKSTAVKYELSSFEEQKRQSRAQTRPSRTPRDVKSPSKVVQSAISSNQPSRKGGGGRTHRGSSDSSQHSSSDRTPAAEKVIVVSDADIIRINLWQKQIQLSNIDRSPDETDEHAADDLLDGRSKSEVVRTNENTSPLKVLNLSRNKIAQMPSCLACCCPRLTRLDVSGNELESLGPLQCLPATLKHINASNNCLTKCFINLELPESRPDVLTLRLFDCEMPDRFKLLNRTANGNGNHQETGPSMSVIRNSRSRSKSVVRSQRSLSVAKNSDLSSGLNKVTYKCPHKSHCRLEALKTLNLANNSLRSMELLLSISEGRNNVSPAEENMAQMLARLQFDGNMDSGREFVKQIKCYVLFPALVTLDLNYNELRTLPPTIALLDQLSVLNLSNNQNLEDIPAEVCRLEKLWNLNVRGCTLCEPLRCIVNNDRYKTSEIMAHLRNKLENSKPYPKLKLMLLGGKGVGKTTLLQMVRQEGKVPMKNAKDNSWSRRMGHSPSRASSSNNPPIANKSTATQGTINYNVVDVSEWYYQPKRPSKSTPSSSQHKNQENLTTPIAFRTWDFIGIQQMEVQIIQQFFFTRRCLYLLLWRITDGELGVQELHDSLFKIQAYAPNASVFIVGTHSDHIRENPNHFPLNYLKSLDDQIQRRFVNAVDNDKRGLPKVLGSLYISSNSRDDVKSLCSLIYQCSVEMRYGPGKTRLVEEQVPSAFFALERALVSMADEFRLHKQGIPFIRLEDLWSLVNQRIIDQGIVETKGKSPEPPQGVPFRDIVDLRNACKFLHDNGIVCYYSESKLREFVIFDPPWFCHFLKSIFLSEQANSTPIFQSSAFETMLRQSIRRLNEPSAEITKSFRHYIVNLLSTFNLVLPFSNRMYLLPSFLPDEYLMRADYPGAKVTFRSKHNKWIPRLATNSTLSSANAKITRSVTDEISQSQQAPLPLKSHQKLIRTLPYRRESTAADADSPDLNAQTARLLFIEIAHENSLRRLYLMQYIPPGFWGRLIARILDSDKFGSTLAKLFVICRVDSNNCQTTVNSQEVAQILNTFNNCTKYSKSSSTQQLQTPPASDAEEASSEAGATTLQLNKPDQKDSGLSWFLWKTGMEIRSFNQNLICSIKQFLPLASVADVNYSLLGLKRLSEGHWFNVHIDQGIGWEASSSTVFIVEILIPHIQMRIQHADVVYEVHTDLKMAARLLATLTSLLDDLLEDWFPAIGTRFVHLSEGSLLVDRLVPCNVCASEAILAEKGRWTLKNEARAIHHSPLLTGQKKASRETDYSNIQRNHPTGRPIKTGANNNSSGGGGIPKSKSAMCDIRSSQQSQNDEQNTGPQATPFYLFCIEECIVESRKLLSNDGGSGNRGVSSPQKQHLALVCPRHPKSDDDDEQKKKTPDLNKITPDLLFLDLLDDEILVPTNLVRRGRLIGQGAFGFVFNGVLSDGGNRRMVSSSTNVALKILEPIDPASISLIHEQTSVQAAIQMFWMKWRNDLLENTTRAYCTTRQELGVLADLKHPHIVSLLGFCLSPLTLIFELAPHAALDQILAKYRRDNIKVHNMPLQKTCYQIARALDYLHSSRIVYRDLKSANVLVWRFPLPSSRFSISDVHLKLGDYGISRHMYSSGICKGYGGTEAFMAPEVILYGGEQEYSESVDIFSFGMFLYELLTLKQPYEGQDQMKEYILEGRKPHVSDKELLYPTNLLDLMIVCWAEHAEHRPSAGDLVTICSAPELVNCLDISLLTDQIQLPIVASVVTTSSGKWLANFDEEDITQFSSFDSALQQSACWMVGKGVVERGCQIAHLSFSQFGWMDKKILDNLVFAGSPRLESSKNQKKQSEKFRTQITIMCQVDEENIWIGDSQGRIHIFAISTFQEIFQFETSSINNTKEEEVQDYSDKAHSAEVRSILSFIERQIVVVALPSAVLICRALSTEGVQPLAPPQFLTSIKLRKDTICSMGILPSLGDWQIWTGHSDGRIFAHHISSSTDRLTFSSSLSHSSLLPSAALSSSIDHDCLIGSVTFIVVSTITKNLVWTALENDNRVFMWQNGIIAKVLDCSKILPVSESIPSMRNLSEISSFTTAGENNAPPAGIVNRSSSISAGMAQHPTAGGGHHHITAMSIVEVCGKSRNGSDTHKRLPANCFANEEELDHEQLIVGTNRGVLIVIQAREMLPLTSFRPYSCPIELILSCSEGLRTKTGHRSSTSGVLQNELVSQAIPSVSHTQSNSSSNIDAKNGSTLRKDSSSDKSLSERKSKPASDESSSMVPTMFKKRHSLEKSRTMMLQSNIVDQPPKSDTEVDPGAAEEDKDDFYGTVWKGVRGLLSGRGAGSEDTPQQKQHRNFSNTSAEGFYITVGAGYRPLLNRFVDVGGRGSTMKERPRTAEEGQFDRCAIFWRTTDQWNCK